MKLKKLAAVMALGLGLGAMAAPAYSGNLYFFEDDDLEWVLRPDGAGGYTEITSGTLSKGDVLYSAFEMPTFEINGVNAIPAGMELTGVAAIEVDTAAGGTFTFKPWSNLSGDLGLGAGAMVAMWLNDLSPNVDLVGANSGQLSCATRGGCTAQVTEGTLFQVDGFLGDPDEFWTALATTTNLATIKSGSATTPFAIFNAGLSNLFNAWGPVGFIDPADGSECADTTGCVQFLVSGNVLGGAGLGDTTIVGRSDFQGQKYVPEPGTVALLGMGLLGLGATLRRRKA